MRPLLLTLAIIMMGNATHKIQPLTNSPGIYFERIQDLYYTETDWKVLVFIDIAPMQYNTSLITQTLQTIKEKCLKTQKDPFFCNVLLERMNYIQKINNRTQGYYDELLNSMKEAESIDYSMPSKHMKRGAPFSFIGSLSKTLFGTLTEEEGHIYNTKINELFKGQKKIAEIANEESHIVEHELAKIEKEINQTKEQIKGAVQLFANRANELTDMTNIWHNSEMYMRFTQTINALETALIIYKDTFQILTEAVRSARKGVLHPSLLSTARLQRIIRQIIDLRPSYEFPIPIPYARPDKLADIAPVRLGFRQNKFLIEVNIPLLNKFPTELYKMHPIPILQHHEDHVISAYIKPQAPYIAVSHDKRAYSLLTDQNLGACTHTTHYRICTHNQPIFEADNNAACEYLLLNQPSEDSLKKCDVHFLPRTTPYWIHLDSLDGWLFSVPSNTTLQILCPGEQHHLSSISGVGVLQLNSKCTARHDRVTLMGMKTIGQSSDLVYLPNIHLDITFIDKDFFPKLIEINDSLLYPHLTGKITPEQLEGGLSLKKIQDKYNNFILDQTNQVRESTLVYSSIGSSLILILIVVIAIMLCAHNIKLPACLSRKEKQSYVTRSNSLDFTVMRPINVIEHPQAPSWRSYNSLATSRTFQKSHPDINQHSDNEQIEPENP